MWKMLSYKCVWGAVLLCAVLPGLYGQFQHRPTSRISSSRLSPRTGHRSRSFPILRSRLLAARPRVSSTRLREIQPLGDVPSIRRSSSPTLLRGAVRAQPTRQVANVQREIIPARIATRLSELPPIVQRRLSQPPRWFAVQRSRQSIPALSSAIQPRRSVATDVYDRENPLSVTSPLALPESRTETITSAGSRNTPIKTLGNDAGIQPIVSSAGIQPRDDGVGIQVPAISSKTKTHVSSVGKQSRVSSSGPQIDITDAGIQVQFSSSGIQPQVSSARIQSRVSSSGPQIDITDAGIQVQFSSSGIQPQVSSTGIQSHVSSSGSDLSGAGVQQQVSPPGDAYHQELVDAFTQVIEGHLTPQRTVIQTASQPIASIPHHVIIPNQPVPQLGLFNQYSPYTAYNPYGGMSSLTSMNPWMLPDMMQEMMYGDTQDPPDGLTTTAAPVPITQGTANNTVITAEVGNVTVPVTGVINRKVPIEAAVKVASVVNTVNDVTIDMKKTQDVLKTVDLKAIDTTLSNSNGTAITEVKVKAELSEVAASSLSTGSVKPLLVDTNSKVDVAKVKSDSSGLVGNIANTVDLKQEGIIHGVEVNLKHDSTDITGLGKNSVEITTQLKSKSHPVKILGEKKQLLVDTVPAIVDNTKDVVSAIVDLTRKDSKLGIFEKSNNVASKVVDKTKDIVSALVDKTKGATIGLDKTKGTSISVDKTKEVSVSLDKTKEVLVSVNKTKEVSVVVDKIKDVSVVIDKIKDVPVVIDKIKDVPVVGDKIKDVPVVIDKINDVPVVIDKIKDVPVVEDKIKDVSVVIDKIKDVPVSVDKTKEVSVSVDKIKDVPVVVDKMKDVPVIVDRTKEVSISLDITKDGSIGVDKALDSLAHAIVDNTKKNV